MKDKITYPPELRLYDQCVFAAKSQLRYNNVVSKFTSVTKALFKSNYILFK